MRARYFLLAICTFLRQPQKSRNYCFCSPNPNQEAQIGAEFAARLRRAVSLLLGACGAESQPADSESKYGSNSHFFPVLSWSGRHSAWGLKLRVFLRDVLSFFGQTDRQADRQLLDEDTQDSS